MRHVRNFARANRYTLFSVVRSLSRRSLEEQERITRRESSEERKREPRATRNDAGTQESGENLHVARGKRFGIRC